MLPENLLELFNNQNEINPLIMYKKKFIFFLLIVFSIHAYSQTDANIVGHVVSNGEHLPFATISIQGTTIGTATDNSGHYQLNNLPEGDFLLKASAVGFKTKEVAVKLEKEKTVEVKFELEEDVISLDQVVVSANKNETSRKEAGVIVNSINSKTFETTNSVNVAESMNFQPGVRLETNCQNCGFQQVRINGLDGPYSQILIDSRPVFSALSGVYGIEQLPVSMIDRVEVVRGGGSALFGSNAIGGTINIITKEPNYNSFSLSNNNSLIDGQTADISFDMNASIVTEDRKSGIAVFGSNRNRDFYDANGDGFSELGTLENTSFGFRAYHKTSNYSKLSLEYHTLNEFRRGGNDFDLQPHNSDITEQVEHNVHAGGLNYTLLSRNYNSKMNLYTSLQSTHRDSYYGAGEDPYAYGNTDDLAFVSGAQFNYSFDNLLFAKAEFVAGVEYLLNTLNDYMPGYDRELNQKVNIYSAFVQNEWNTDFVNILLGGRIDKHNLISEPIFSPRINFLFKLSEKLSSRLTYSQGFRAPQAFDEDLHIGAVGGEVHIIRLAEDLKTEKSHSVSTSFDYYITLGNSDINFLVEGFFTKLDNVFTLVEVGKDAQGNQLLERQNAAGAEVYGVNLEGRFVFSPTLQLQTGFTLQESKYTNPELWSDDETIEGSKNMFRTPKAYGYFTVTSSPLPKFNLSLSGVYTGSMYVPHYAGYINSDVLEKSEEFLEINIKLSKKISFSDALDFQLNAGVQNILNSYQADFDEGFNRDAGYIYGPSRPRTFFVGIKIGSSM